MKSRFKFNVTLSWSKIVAFIMLIFSFTLSMHTNEVSSFIASLPFVAMLIMGKQYFDLKREKKDEKDEKLIL